MNVPPRKKEGSSQGPIILRMPWPKCGAQRKNQWIFVDFIHLFIFPMILGGAYRVHITYHWEKSKKQFRAFQKMKCKQEWVFCFLNVLWDLTCRECSSN